MKGSISTKVVSVIVLVGIIGIGTGLLYSGYIIKKFEVQKVKERKEYLQHRLATAIEKKRISG
ncbi:hypothetical protein [Desulfobacter hydrogenophilus]|uniref:Uncharacterized protein n=1 Tax=Desulfobacter hydrogenophilus TaxID=2291 RepID=A0ABX5RI79_9BACT|nr:hypothetical protein [Desulfobacter hydrogenophilus]NDY73775.1 hypothetical protein [Desulfobacter hydrogenophilus]QBH14640.1 hypothetical protein EYB58_17940 [Desulfobacter hydrogenophilus]